MKLHPYASTFSICAVDTETGEAGAACASYCLAAAGLVLYARPGVGAIATQAFVNPAYGRDGLDLLAKGLPAERVVGRLTDADFTLTDADSPDVAMYNKEGMTEEGVDFHVQAESGRIVWYTSRIRQLGVVDRRGRAATHSGARIHHWFGSVVGEGFCCQGNRLAGEEVVAAMAEAFQRGRRDRGSMIARLMSALHAGEDAGGDRAGKQAAGILVVRDRGNWTGTDNYCDLRVDDHADPVAELTRILRKARFQ